MASLVTETLAQIGAQLRHARLQAHLTQQDVARRANVSRQLVGRIENGFNAEASAYIAVASALDYRLTVAQEVPLNDNELAALDLINNLQAPPTTGQP
ncbi:helix-turn-helix transcriptional regulator [Mycobacterium simiae]|uniref:Helix-turn-helix transcriptional regulator n=1 Tax=Mycobacterium simiae TaxID=1784 RepID=A0A5B1BQZ1_MYCSI|nr:helix-turn-helix transcriptional regulator [Mycobacterium simiae]KAA1250205.1 helix-turn-helix transcriptional regulator [Mycobacterium simiae]